MDSLAPADFYLLVQQQLTRGWNTFNEYLGRRRSNQRKVAADLAKKGADLLLAEWRTHRHVHENYDANSGQGCNSSSSDRFYHWDALLGIPALIDAEKIAPPEARLE